MFNCGRTIIWSRQGEVQVHVQDVVRQYTSSRQRDKFEVRDHRKKYHRPREHQKLDTRDILVQVVDGQAAEPEVSPCVGFVQHTVDISKHGVSEHVGAFHSIMSSSSSSHCYLQPWPNPRTIPTTTRTTRITVMVSRFIAREPSAARGYDTTSSTTISFRCYLINSSNVFSVYALGTLL